MSSFTNPVSADELGPSREQRRLPIFDGVRGLCAVALLVVHIAWTARLTGSYSDPPTNMPVAVVVNGFQIAVGVFFLISGLFLFRPFARAIITDTPRPELGPYFARRLLRLMPAYYMVVAACLLLLNFNSIDSLWYVLRPILMVQNYDNVWMAGMDITWTVPTEVQWYLVMPLIAVATGAWARKGANPRARAHRLLIIVPILFLVGVLWFMWIHQPSMGIFPKQYWWPVGVAGNFGAGIGLGTLAALKQVSPEDTPRLLTTAARRPMAFWAGALVVFAINCAQPFAKPGYGDYHSLAAALTFYVLFIAFCTLVILPMVAGARSRVIDVTLGNPISVYLGRISYGIYLWHFFVLNLYLGSGSVFGGDPIIVPAMRGMAGAWELESAVLIGTVIVASISFFLVERPLLNWGDRRLRERAARKRREQGITTGAVTPTHTG